MARNRRLFREIFHVPAERMEYYYMLMDELPDPLEGVIGYIFNDTCEGLRIALEVDEEYLKQQKSIYPMLYVDPENYLQECRIVLTPAMVHSLKKGDPEVVYAVWHELGHFHTMEENVEEYLSYSPRNQEGYSAEQYLSIVNGEVLPYELAADRFAVDYCGKDNGIIAMNGMIARAKKNSLTYDNRGLMQDLLNRKKQISRMEDA